MERPVSVLHVDGDAEFRRQTAEGLESHGDRFGVETTDSPAAALDRLCEGNHDCVVSGYDLADRTGVEFLEAVRKAQSDLPFIMFAAAGDETVASDAIAAGVTDYIPRTDEREQVEVLRERIEDAVEEYRATRRLRRRMDLFEMAQEIVDLGAWEVDLGTDAGWWTEGVKDIYGLPEDADPDPGDRIEYLHPDDRPTVEAALYDAVYEAEPYDLEVRVSHDDDHRWVRAVGEPQTNGDDVVRVREMLQDITDRKRRQNVLKALHRVATGIQTAQTIEGVCDQMVRATVEVLDLDVCTVLLRDGEWLVPREPPVGSLPPDSRPLRLDEGVAGETYRSRQSFLLDDISSWPEAVPASDEFRAIISVPMGDHGVFQAVSSEVGAYDKTDLEYAGLLASHAASALDRIDREEELKRQNERLEEFASIVSHDLRNPLNVAQLRLHLVREEVDNDDIESIAQAHDRMEQLIEDLLAMARAGNPPEEIEAVALSRITREAWHNVETEDAELVTETDGAVQANESRLQQLLENLVRNAVEHGATDAAPTVTVGEIDNEGFYVADDGPGIPADERDQIFDSGYTTRDDGTGFGLPIVEDVVEAHDWEIGVTESESGGARFEVTGVTFTGPADRSKSV